MLVFAGSSPYLVKDDVTEGNVPEVMSASQSGILGAYKDESHREGWPGAKDDLAGSSGASTRDPM